MSRTIGDAAVKRFHDDDHEQPRNHRAEFIGACNFRWQLKTLNGLTPYEFICKIRTSEPDRFIPDPTQLMPGLNSQGITSCRT